MDEFGNVIEESESIEYDGEPAESIFTKTFVIASFFVLLFVAGSIATISFFYSGLKDDVVVVQENVQDVDTIVPNISEIQKVETSKAPALWEVFDSYPNLDNFTIYADDTNPDLFWVSGFTTLYSYDVISKEIIDYSLLLPSNGHSISGFATTEEFLVVGYQGLGVMLFNRTTSQTTLYTQEDALASNSNIRVFADSFDEDTVWLSTFEGLSQLSLSTGEIQSYTKEMNIAGSTWEPEVFYVDADFVWVTISANAYTTGGVARLTKTTQEWKSWNSEDFIQGDTPSRFDASGAVGNDQYIVVEEDGVVYRYDDVLDSWDVVMKYPRSSSVRQYVSVIDSIVYFVKDDELFALDVQTGGLVSDAIIEQQNNPVSSPYKNKKVAYQKTFNRFIISPKNFSGDDFSVLSTKVDSDGMLKYLTYPLKPFFDSFQSNNITVLAVEKSDLMYTEKSNIFVRDVTSSDVEVLTTDENDGWKYGAIYDNYYLYHTWLTCGIGCTSDSVERGTTTIFSRIDKSLISSITLENTSREYTHQFTGGDSVEKHRLFFSRYDDGSRLEDDPSSSYRLNQRWSAYVADTDSEYEETRSYNFGEYKSIDVADFDLKLAYQVSGQGDSVLIRYQLPNGTSTTISMSLTSDSSSRFVNNYFVNKVVVKENTVWFATDRGLIALDLETMTDTLYSTADGLVSNDIIDLWVGDRFIMKHTGGVYIYE